MRPRDHTQQVYPRVCGGTIRLFLKDVFNDGLSPRVRGNHARFRHLLDHVRSIPACAGEPGRNRNYTARLTVYPRVCGGTILTSSSGCHWKGLSPRVRGNLGTSILLIVRLRSIPACAGEPLRPGGRHKGWGVYPRVCGGTPLVEKLLRRLSGLSPRVRGNLQAEHLATLNERSIPACAGEPLANVIEYARYYS